MSDDEGLTTEELSLLGGGEATVPEWAEKIEDTDVRTALSKFESEQAFLDAMGFEVTGDPGDWRDDLSDELKPVAERFTSKEDALRAIVAFQKREGQVRVPGKDATDAERIAYHKAVGIPDSAEGYEFPALPEGETLTDEAKVSQQAWAKRFYDLSVPKETANALIAAAREEGLAQNAAQKEADTAFAKASDDALRAEWKGDEFEKNEILAGRAFEDIANRAGLSKDDLKMIETKDGRFLLDRPEIIKLFAVIGREMGEGSLGPTLTDSERETMDEQIRDVRKQTEEAKAEGDSKRANMLYQREQALIAKKDGNAPIVGSAGKVA